MYIPIVMYITKKERKKASSPVKHNNQLKDGDGLVNAHRKQKREAENSIRRSLK